MIEVPPGHKVEVSTAPRIEPPKIQIYNNTNQVHVSYSLSNGMHVIAIQDPRDSAFAVPTDLKDTSTVALVTELHRRITSFGGE